MSKPRLTDADFCRAADMLGVEVAAVKAVAQQESLGAGFDGQDRPVILFERHKFHAYTHGKYDKAHPGISNSTAGGYGSSASQYGRFSEAFDLDPNAAMRAASWGKFQVLGDNYKICGFLSVDGFVDAMKESEGRQLDAFCAFVLHNGLDVALTDHDWAAFAAGYNGSGFRRNHYDTKIAAGYVRFSKEKIDCGKIPAATAANDGVLPSNSLNTETQDEDPASTLSASTAIPALPDASGADFTQGDRPVDSTPLNQTADNITNVGLLDKAGAVGDKFASFRGVMEKFGFADDGWAMSLGTKLFAWAKMASGNIMLALGFITGHWELILAGVVILALAAWLWNEARKRNLMAKSGVPVEVIAEVAKTQ